MGGIGMVVFAQTGEAKLTVGMESINRCSYVNGCFPLSIDDLGTHSTKHYFAGLGTPAEVCPCCASGERR
jgi:hypothetical protein